MADLHKIIITEVNLEHPEWEYIALDILDNYGIEFCEAFEAVYELKTAMVEHIVSIATISKGES